jgi:predicted RNase H-like HicB family nuclease
MGPNERADTLVDVYLAGRYRELVTEATLPGGDSAWVARYPSIPGCVAQATSLQAALSALRRLREPYLRALYEGGVDLPPPDYPGQPRVTVGAVLLESDGQPASFITEEDADSPLSLPLIDDSEEGRAHTFKGRMAMSI